MPNKIITISLAEELLAKIDQLAAEDFTSRSDVIRQAAVERLRVVDEYRVRLAAAANSTDIPTEEEILRWLRIKAGQRWARSWRREMRKS
jgi:Arc/MetJ-type ribon-helix-helix transcriptional regulator